MLGGPALVLSWLASSRPEYARFNARSLSIDRVINLAEMPLLAMGILLISMGFIGLLVRYSSASGAFGRYSLGLAVLAGVVCAAGIVGLGVTKSDPWWTLFFLGVVFQFLGATLFGVARLKHHVLPRWNGLPLLAGLWVPLFTLVNLIVAQLNGTWPEWSDWAFYLIWLLSLIGLAGIGLVLQASDVEEAGIFHSA